MTTKRIDPRMDLIFISCHRQIDCETWPLIEMNEAAMVGEEEDETRNEKGQTLFAHTLASRQTDGLPGKMKRRGGGR